MFISSTPPVIHDNTIILAATHPNINSGNPNKDGWFLSDFYAFNYLLKGIGAEQKWLTAVDPHSLVEEYSNYLHGDSFESRKEVLSHALLHNGKLSPVTIVKSEDMIDAFIYEARQASEHAKQNNAPLLLLVFCHGLPDVQLLLNNDDRKKRG